MNVVFSPEENRAVISASGLETIENQIAHTQSNVEKVEEGFLVEVEVTHRRLIKVSLPGINFTGQNLCNLVAMVVKIDGLFSCFRTL